MRLPNPHVLWLTIHNFSDEQSIKHLCAKTDACFSKQNETKLPSNSLRYPNYWVNKGILNRTKMERIKKRKNSHYDYSSGCISSFSSSMKKGRHLRMFQGVWLWLKWKELKSIFFITVQWVHPTNCIIIYHTVRSRTKLRN